jgi:hypothetical protein
MRNWYYHFPDLLLALLSYLLIARLLLLPFRSAQNVLVRTVGALTAPVVATVAALTAPVVATVAALTPRLVPQPLLLLAALAWLYAARLILRVGIAATGVRLG